MAKKTTIAGNTFLFTGKLTEFTREDAEAHVEAEGGKVLSGVSAKLNYLVVGEGAGSKLAKAEALGTVTILHEKEFLKMMGTGQKKISESSKKGLDKSDIIKIVSHKNKIGNDFQMTQNIFPSLDDKWKNDKEVVMAAVLIDGLLLQFASENLKADIDVVFTAVRKNGNVLQYASSVPQNNKKVVLAAVNEYGDALEYASNSLKDNKEVVLAAVKNSYSAIQYASDKIKKDKEIVLAAVNEYGDALKFVSKELQADREVVLAAVKNVGMVLQFASKLLRNDREIVMAAIKNDSRSLQFASKEFQTNSENNSDEFITKIGKTENQQMCFFDVSKVNFKNIKKNAKIISLNELGLFENGYPLSKKASQYSSFDFSALFNPKVLFLTFLSGHQGALNITFSAEPTDSIFEGYGRLNKNLHLSISIGDGEMEITLEREHFYDFDNIDDDDILKKCEKIEKKDKSNKKWKPFIVSNLNYDDFEKFLLKFKKHFNEEDIWL